MVGDRVEFDVFVGKNRKFYEALGLAFLVPLQLLQ